jgi:hypothetical protein
MSVPALEKENNDAYEKRTWRNRMHVVDGEVVIPPMALKNCLSECAKYLSVQIPGKGKATYTKHFEAGIMITEPLRLGIKPEDVPGEELYLNADGRRGGSVRVTRIMPHIANWKAEAEITILDETITAEVLRRHLEEAGMLIGMGRFRPRKNGYYGRFAVKKFQEVG